MPRVWTFSTEQEGDRVILGTQGTYCWVVKGSGKGGCVFRIEERLASLVAETRQRSSLGPGKGGWRTNVSSRPPDSTRYIRDEDRELLVRPASSALCLRNSSRQCGSVSFTNEETSPDRVRDLAKPESKLQPFPQPRGCSQTVTPTHTAAEFRFS